jgi:hypothetical protein
MFVACDSEVCILATHTIREHKTDWPNFKLVAAESKFSFSFIASSHEHGMTSKCEMNRSKTN